MYHEIVFHSTLKPIANWTFKCIINECKVVVVVVVLVHLAGCDPTGVVDDSNQLGYVANKAETNV